MGSKVRAGIIGATGFGGGELVRLLSRHPDVQLVSLHARGRTDEAISVSHPHLRETNHRIVDGMPEDVDAVFLGLPHGAAAQLVPALMDRGIAVIDLGPDFRLRSASDYPTWYRFEHPRPDLLAAAVYGLPELHRAELEALRSAPARIVASPGCYATTAILALAPLAREGLVEDVVVDAKSGVSGAGREARPDMQFAEVNESVRAYGIGGHRHIAEMEQELAGLAGRALPPIDFLPHLVPMTRGILAACHVRPSRAVDQAELDELYRAAYEGERFVDVVDAAPATKHVSGSNTCRIYIHLDARSGRILVLGVLDNLVKGAAGQAIQAFNIVFDLPEDRGLEQLPLAP